MGNMEWMNFRCVLRRCLVDALFRCRGVYQTKPMIRLISFPFSPPYFFRNGKDDASTCNSSYRWGSFDICERK